MKKKTKKNETFWGGKSRMHKPHNMHTCTHISQCFPYNVCHSTFITHYKNISPFFYWCCCCRRRRPKYKQNKKWKCGSKNKLMFVTWRCSPISKIIKNVQCNELGVVVFSLSLLSFLFCWFVFYDQESFKFLQNEFKDDTINNSLRWFPCCPSLFSDSIHQFFLSFIVVFFFKFHRTIRKEKLRHITCAIADASSAWHPSGSEKA